MAAHVDENEPPRKVLLLEPEEKETKQESVKINVERNSRYMIEHSVCGKHVSIPDLTRLILEDSTIWEQTCSLVKNEDELSKCEARYYREKPKILDYLHKDYLVYPTPVEFHVANVAHVTTKEPFLEILQSKKFRPPVMRLQSKGVPVPQSDLTWWDLKIQKEEISDAEERYPHKIVRSLQNEKGEEMKIHMSFQHHITTSPLFKLRESRYGRYRFTFPLLELMDLYKKHNCDGKEPVLRVFKTIFYKQEIVYAVLVHSPENNELFRDFPLLEESDFVSYQDGKITWRAQALSETNMYEFSSEGISALPIPQFYVWDQVSLVFHVDGKLHKSIKVPEKRLIEALEHCSLAELNLLKYENDSDFEAQMLVRHYKRELEEPNEDEKENTPKGESEEEKVDFLRQEGAVEMEPDSKSKMEQEEKDGMSCLWKMDGVKKLEEDECEDGNATRQQVLA